MNLATETDAEKPESPPEAVKRSSLIGTFAFRDFRLLWFGLLISNIGTWMQLTALGYLVVSSAKNEGDAAFRLGLIGVSQALPALLLSPVAGVVADVFRRKQILLLTNTLVAALALLLAVLVTIHITPLNVLMLISATSAAARTFDAPARQSWVPLLVDRAYLSNAIGLNSLAFNAPSAVGPSIAGFFIASVSIASSFYANAVCTLAVIVALIFMDAAPAAATRQGSFVHAFMEGAKFLAGHPVLRWIILGLVCNSLLVRPYVQLLPALAIHVFKLGPAGLGILLGASGFGAILGALTTALVGNIEHRARLWATAGLLVGLCVAVIGTLHLLPSICMVLAAAGFCTLMFVGSSNILIQTLAPDEMRGRAVSAFSMIVLGIVPLGTLSIGSLASMVGLREALMISGLIAAFVTGCIWLSQERLREA